MKDYYWKLALMAILYMIPILFASLYLAVGVTKTLAASDAAIGFLLSMGSYFVLCPVNEIIDHCCFNEEDS